MTRYTSRADLLIAAGESIKMQEKAGVNEPVVKYNGEIAACDELNYTTRQHGEYEFPLAVVEGKPVFLDDKLYSPLGIHFTVIGTLPFDPSTCSWNPPKPKTVMVELPIEDVERMAKPYVYVTVSDEGIAACRKALEKA